MDLRAYLRRIAYSGPIAPTLETLRLLHRRHLEAAPFENLDIGRSRRIVLDKDAIIRKIVEERRGGFCYELNGAFAELLLAVGFRVTLLSDRVSRADGTHGPEFDHLALRVDLEEPWLADVGFGDFFLEPLRLAAGIQQRQDAGTFQIGERDTGFNVEKWQPDASWKSEYLLTLTPRRLEDFEGMCEYHQTSPASSFTQSRVCSIAVPDGRITLAELNLIVTKNGIRKERMLASEDERAAALKQHFGIVLPA